VKLGPGYGDKILPDYVNVDVAESRAARFRGPGPSGKSLSDAGTARDGAVKASCGAESAR